MISSACRKCTVINDLGNYNFHYGTGPTIYDILSCGGGLRAQKAPRRKLTEVNIKTKWSKNDADVVCGWPVRCGPYHESMHLSSRVLLMN